MIDAAGKRRLWAILTAQVDDSFAGGTIQVTDGEQVASAPVESFRIDDDGDLTVVATFGERDANFEHRERRFLSREGVVIDHAEEDGGRKVLGAVWSVEVTLELASTEAPTLP